MVCHYNDLLCFRGQVNNYSYQDTFSKKIPFNKGVLALDTGLGKTKIIIDGLRGFKEVTIVCPAMLRLNWEEEFKKWNFPGKYNIYSYNQLTRFFVSSKPKEYDYANAYEDNGVLIFDEAHYLRTHNSERTKLAARACHLLKPHTLWFVTATPILRSAENLYPICYMLDREKTPKLGEYRETWCEKKKNPYKFNGYEYTGVKLGFWGWFRRNFKLLRLKKEDVLSLPPKLYETVRIEAPPSLYLENNGLTVEEAEAKLLANKGDTFAEQRRALGLHKAVEAAKLIKEMQLNRDEQFIVFAYHREVVTWLADELNAEKIYGDTTMSMRQKLITSFQQGHFRALILSTGAGGVGITLTAAARLYWVEKPYLYAEEKQCEDRIHRIGQHKSVSVINVYAPRTLDVAIERNLRSRQGLHDDMFARTGKQDGRW